MTTTPKHNLTKHTNNLSTVDYRLPGLLLVVSGLQWFFSVLIAESLYPSYNSRIHYISTLGRPPTAPIFAASTILMGILTGLVAIQLYHTAPHRLFTVLFLITSLGAIGVGIFPETIQPAHGIFQTFALVGGALSALTSYKLQSRSLAIISAILGMICLTAIIVFFPFLGLGLNDPITFLGLGKGTLERIVIYPLILWMISFGSQLMVLRGDPRYRQ